MTLPPTSRPHPLRLVPGKGLIQAIIAPRHYWRLAWLLGMGCCLASGERQTSLETPGRVLVIAHRGASMERPEHTLAGYRLAMEQGADFIEPDLRMTKDGVFIALHDESLNRTTDVAAKPEFANRARPDAKGRMNWLPGDFTLAEIKTLKTKQGSAGRAKGFDGRETVPTLQEIVDLVRAYRRQTGRVVGLMPELRGNAAEFVRFVKAQGLEDKERGIPLYLQSFSLEDLKNARPHLTAPAAWLVEKWPEPKDWPALKQHIDAFAVNKDLALTDDGSERIAKAHAAGFKVIAWTFADDSYQHARFATPREELRRALDHGIDAFFTDSTASGVLIRDAATKPSTPSANP